MTSIIYLTVKTTVETKILKKNMFLIMDLSVFILFIYIVVVI